MRHVAPVVPLLPLRLISFLVIAAALVRNSPGQDVERLKLATVGIEVGKAEGEVFPKGTGLIILAAHRTSGFSGKVSVITARHLFYQGNQRLPGAIFMTFYFGRLNPFKAALVTESAALDLAVLETDDDQAIPDGLYDQLPIFALTSSSAPAAPVTPLHVIGVDSKQNWQVASVAITASRDADSSDILRFAGTGDITSFEGAPVFDDNGRLTALCLRFAGDGGEALSLVPAYRALANLGVAANKLNFENTTSPAAIPHTAAFGDIPAGSQKAGDEHVNNVDGFSYRWIPPTPAEGFQIGCSPGDKYCNKDEKPHNVKLTSGFWMGQTEVTQAAFRKVMQDNNPSFFKGDDLPMDSVTWSEAKAYCAHVGGRLPTEAEWEWAARAGTKKKTYADIEKIAWYGGKYGVSTQPAGKKLPNAWGLRDILGNVYEWTSDWYWTYPSGAMEGSSTDPTAPDPSRLQNVAIRGASVNSAGLDVRVSSRWDRNPDERDRYVGFRCVAQ